MPISFSLPQPTGTVATYHVVSGGRFTGTSSLIAEVSSYLSQATYAAGDQPITNLVLDISFVLPTAATNPPTGATISQVVNGIVENAIIASGVLAGGTIVA